MKVFLMTLLALTALSLVNLGYAEGKVTINEQPEGSVSEQDGLQAWELVYQVASHPRCVNCHAGETPMWSGPSYGKTRPHGMNVQAGMTRLGADTMQCATCHVTLPKTDPNLNKEPHTAPKVAMPWAMAPIEADWFNKSSNEICEQLKDPARNGNRTMRQVAEHLDHDIILHWSWEPGGDREPAPHSLQKMVDAIMTWSAAGTPCPPKGTQQEANNG